MAWLPDLGPWDLVLIAVVSLQTTVVAYVSSPRVKTIFLTLPFPFTVVALSVGLPLGASNVLSLVLLFAYIHAIRWLHDGLRVPIVPAIGLAVAAYAAVGWGLADLVPSGPAAFWPAVVAVIGLGAVLFVRSAPRAERAHRTRLPVALKLPAVLAVVLLLVLIKHHLGGFATLFPLVSVAGAYEARHCLWTMTLTVPFLMLTLVPLMTVAFVTQPWLGLGGGLAAGWGVFLLLYPALMRWQWRRWPPVLAAPEGMPPRRAASG